MTEKGPATITMPAAIKVQGAYKRYPQHIVLRGLNLNLPQGCIYGLLGPSGCGKTTLLSCIVGRQQLDAGDIHVTPNNKQKIGYMPQDLSLNPLLNIHETLIYYGLLAGKSKAEILARIDELLELLELPSPHRKLENISGGQQRRVSLCVALLHNPDLLILDEPTVGLDPVLNEKIWKVFLHLTTQENKAILITTHYIEETKQANLVGLMREGVLLAEESPQALLSRHDCDTLEDAFLLLCRQQSTSKITQEGKELEYPIPQKQLNSPLQDQPMFSMKSVVAELLKNIFWAKGNVGIMLFIFLIPTILTILFCVCLGKDPKGLDMGIVNDEIPLGLSQCSTYPLRGCHLETPLSCRYLQTLAAKHIDMVGFNSYQEGLEALKKNDIWGLLYFPSQYSNMLLKRQNNGSITDEELQLADIDVRMDMSNLLIGNLLKASITTSFYDFMKELYHDCGWPTKNIDNPITFEKPVYGSQDSQFSDYSSQAFITLLIFTQPMANAMGALTADKNAGIFDRSSVAGAELGSVFVGTAIWHGLLQALFTGVMVALYLAFDYPFIGSGLLTLTLWALIGACGFNLGFLISMVCVNQNTAGFISMTLLMILSVTSGMMWPIEAMSDVLKKISSVLPLALPTDAVRGVLVRGWSLSQPIIHHGLVIITGWNIFLVVAIILAFRSRKALGW